MSSIGDRHGEQGEEWRGGGMEGGRGGRGGRGGELGKGGGGAREGMEGENIRLKHDLKCSVEVY